MINAIQAGKLTLELTRGQARFNELIALASRENEKRGFLFVSKVLGKHLPVRPAKMRAIYDELALRCVQTPSTSDDGNPNEGSFEGTFVLGMAETATGLGAGIADSLARLQNTPQNQAPVYYQHTTRHALPGHPEWFTIEEAHSHAVEHIIYQPNDGVLSGIQACTRLILVDDEATTGKTLLQLARHLTKHLPKIRDIQIVTLANWLSAERRAAFTALPVPVHFVDLIRGTFTFAPDTSRSVSTPKAVDKDLCQLPSRSDLGRTGLKMPYRLKKTDGAHTLLRPGTTQYTIVGTGEHLYLPFLMAEALERQDPGYDIVFQSTTRSPILPGDAIQRKVRFFIDAARRKENYIYNLPTDRETIILCENESHAAHHGLYTGDYEEAMHQEAMPQEAIPVQTPQTPEHCL